MIEGNYKEGSQVSFSFHLDAVDPGGDVENRYVLLQEIKKQPFFGCRQAGCFYRLEYFLLFVPVDVAIGFGRRNQGFNQYQIRIDTRDLLLTNGPLVEACGINGLLSAVAVEAAPELFPCQF
jgi:hypothetical protein